MLLFSCTSNSDLNTLEKVKESIPQPVTFSTYISKNGITRAQQTGIMSNTELLTTGFGVFAYHTDYSAGATAYNSSSSLPNFMWNQQVTHSTNWGYTPIKYWPNEYGSGASSGANVDKLSFFAYAPYVAAATNGVLSESATEVITAISANNVAGDPKITYMSAANPANSVDLLWAVVPTENEWTGSGSTTDPIADNEVQNNVTLAVGKPWVDITKQTTNGSVKFQFKHALTRLGITVQGMFDEVNNTGSLIDQSTADVNSNSKIMIESITLRGPYRWRGILNLNNPTANTAKWESVSATRAVSDNPATLTLKPTPGAGETGIAETFKWVSGTSVAGYISASKAGVTRDRKDIFTGQVFDSSNPTANRNFYMLVPQDAGETKTDIEIKIVYHIITDDARLAGGKIDITNDITKTVSGLDFSCGKANELNLVLGLTTVKVEAKVKDWDNQTAQDVDLPINQ